MLQGFLYFKSFENNFTNDFKKEINPSVEKFIFPL